MVETLSMVRVASASG